MKAFRFFIKLFIFSALFLHLAGAKKVIEDIDYIYMHPNLPMTYKLPEEYRKQQIKFSGNYKRFTKFEFRKKQNDLLFTPTRTGSAIVVIKNAKNKILNRLVVSIQKDNLHKIAAELRDLLIAVDGIEIKIYNSKVIVDGQVLLPTEMERVKKVIASYKNEVTSYVSYSPRAQKKIAQKIESEIEQVGISVKYAYNRFLIEGCINSQDEKNRALSIANLYTQFEVSPVGENKSRKQVPLIKDNIKVPCPSAKKDKEEANDKKSIQKLIQVVVHFVEMNKSFNKAFLFEWAPGIGQNNQSQISASLGTTGQQQGITGVLTATVSNFFPKLNWAKQFSFARVLHNSSLLMENQVSGTISTATTIPVSKEISASGPQAQVSITVTPTIIGAKKDLIKLKIAITVSSPADIGTTTRNLNTTINVRDGASAVIGGLTSSFLTQNYNTNKTPPNVNPILNLHSSKGYVTKKAQFVVFITPIIKSSASIGVDRIKKKFYLSE